MRKILSLVIIASIVAATLCGCAEGFEAASTLTTSEEATQIQEITMCDQYTVLLYLNSLGFEDKTTPRMDEYDAPYVESYKEEGRVGEEKTVTLFGETVTLPYEETDQCKYWKSKRVWYGNDSVVATFDSQTDKLISYTKSPAVRDRSFQSEINEYSDENAFLAYAKNILSQYTSIEGYDEYEIQTFFREYVPYKDKPGGYYGSCGWENGYVNNTDGAEDFYADYHVTFYKRLSGIRRDDAISIDVSNTGEVVKIKLNTLNVSYEPFKDVVVDLQKAETLIEEAVSKFAPKYNGINRIEYDPVLVTRNDGTLWLRVQAGVYFNSSKEYASAFSYMIKIAEIVQ